MVFVAGLVHDAARAWLAARGLALRGDLLVGRGAVRRLPGGIVRLGWRLVRLGEVRRRGAAWAVRTRSIVLP